MKELDNNLLIFIKNSNIIRNAKTISEKPNCNRKGIEEIKY